MVRTNNSVATSKTSNDSMTRRHRHIDPAAWDTERSKEGEGALSEEDLYIDKNSPDDTFETPAATSIGKASERGELEERLQRINDERDEDADGHSERMHRDDRNRIMEAICSSLPVSPVERELAKKQFEPLDLDQFGNQKAVEKVALATVRYVVDQRRVEHGADYEDLLRESEKYHEAKEQILENSRGFMKLCDNVGDALDEQGFRATTGFDTQPGPDPAIRRIRQNSR